MRGGEVMRDENCLAALVETEEINKILENENMILQEENKQLRREIAELKREVIKYKKVLEII